MSEQTLMVMCGLPGSGKSYFANKYIETHPDYVLVSTDALRKELESEGKDSWLVFVRAYSEMTARIKYGSNVIFDATNLRKRDREKIVKYFKKVFPDLHLKLMIMETPLSICVALDKARKESVGEFRLVEMSNSFDKPSKEEGWDEITFNSVLLGD